MLSAGVRGKRRATSTPHPRYVLQRKQRSSYDARIVSIVGQRVDGYYRRCLAGIDVDAIVDVPTEVRVAQRGAAPGADR